MKMALRLAILTGDPRGFLQSLQETVGLTPQNHFLPRPILFPLQPTIQCYIS
jgi:hypothetical protein